MRRTFDVRRLCCLVAFCPVLVSSIAAVARAADTPAISMDVATGDVLYQEDATQPWFPASTTKLMTVYVALSAIRDHQIDLNTPLVVSARAHAMPPSKMGFPVGSQVTLDNAMKMLMVKSANDIAVTVAEGIAGSVEAFADDMNRAAAQLGMRESHFVNPNGLPNPAHYSSVRDMAILARALYTQFPDEAGLFDLGELSLGRELIVNHNNLLGRYPGIDGMKTGFTCPAGFNIVASAFRDGRRVVVVVFGAPSVPIRSQKVVALFDRAFAGIDRPTASVVSLPDSAGGGPPDMRDEVCRGRGKLIAEYRAQIEQLDAPLLAQPTTSEGIGLSALNPEKALLFNAPAAQSPPPGGPMAPRIMSVPRPYFEPVAVRIGADPGYTGVVAQARAPGTPIGTETPPVSAEAYAAPATTPLAAISHLPLAIDPTALPLRGRRAHTARIPRPRRATMNAAAEAPKTQVIATAPGDTAEAKTTPKRKSAAKAKAPAVAKVKKPVKTKAATKPVEPKKVAAKAKSKADVAN